MNSSAKESLGRCVLRAPTGPKTEGSPGRADKAGAGAQGLAPLTARDQSLRAPPGALTLYERHRSSYGFVLLWGWWGALSTPQPPSTGPKVNPRYPTIAIVGNTEEQSNEQTPGN